MNFGAGAGTSGGLSVRADEGAIVGAAKDRLSGWMRSRRLQRIQAWLQVRIYAWYDIKRKWKCGK